MVKPKDNERTAMEKETVTTPTGEILVTFDALLASINRTAEAATQDPEALQEELFQRMLSAASLDDLLAPSTLVKAKAVIGRTFIAHGVKFNESDIAGGPGVYAVIDAEFDDGRVSVGCGARTVMHQLLIMAHRGWLPASVKIVESKRPTPDGYFPMSLAAAPVEEPW